MNREEIPDTAIEAVAQHINSRNNKDHRIPVVGVSDNTKTPQYFEILPFDEIDNSERSFFAVDGSRNSEDFYNGLSIGLYTAGYVCFQKGKQVRLNDMGDPVILGKAYYPQNILISNEGHAEAILNELLDLEPVKRLLAFFDDPPEQIFAYEKEAITRNLSSLFGFFKKSWNGQWCTKSRSWQA